MKNKFLDILLVVAMGISLVGCGKNNEISTTETSESAADSAEKVTISYGLWGDETRKTYTQAQIKAFEAEYPNIKVELNYANWDTLKDEIDGIMADGRESDLMQINYNWLTDYSSDGKGFYDLNELSDYIQFDAFSDYSLSFGQVNGKQNAVPIAFNTSVPVFNKTMYDYYDLELPESVEELFEAAAIMKADNVYQLGLEDKQIVLFLMGCMENKYGTEITDENGSLRISYEGWEYMAETYKKCLDENVICPRDKYTDTYIEGNRVAGVVCWLNSLEKYKEIIEEAGDEPKVGKFLWTDIDEPLGNFVKPSSMLAISANTQHPEETAMLLDYLCNNEDAVKLQGEEKGVPDSRFAQQYLMKACALNNDTFYSSLRMNYYMEYMNILPNKLEEGDIIEEILTTLDAYAGGEKTLKETVSVLREIK